jgi:hypothetical protein
MNSRVSRSVLPVIGKVFNYLFGVLDESHYEELHGRIENLRNNELDKQHIVKKQVTLIDHTMEDFGQTQRELNKIKEISKFVQNEFTSRQKGVRKDIPEI